MVKNIFFRWFEKPNEEVVNVRPQWAWNGVVQLGTVMANTSIGESIFQQSNILIGEMNKASSKQKIIMCINNHFCKLRSHHTLLEYKQDSEMSLKIIVLYATIRKKV